MNSKNRINKWALDNYNNEALIDCLNHGVYGLQREYGFNKNFREGDLNLLKGNSNKKHTGQKIDDSTDIKPLFFNPIKNYVEATERARMAQSANKKLFLENEPFVENKFKNVLQRGRRKDKELGPNFRYGYRTENQRVRRAISMNKNIDLTVVD